MGAPQEFYGTLKNVMGPSQLSAWLSFPEFVGGPCLVNPRCAKMSSVNAVDNHHLDTGAAGMRCSFVMAVI